MTKAAAIHSFWSSFGLAAYPEASVPAGDDAPAFPYITYELITDGFGESTYMTASLWYRDSSWLAANAKAEEIGARIGYSGVMLECDGGRIWLKRSNPFSQSLGDNNDNYIKRKILSVTADYLTYG